MIAVSSHFLLPTLFIPWKFNMNKDSKISEMPKKHSIKSTIPLTLMKKKPSSHLVFSFNYNSSIEKKQRKFSLQISGADFLIKPKFRLLTRTIHCLRSHVLFWEAILSSVGELSSLITTCGRLKKKHNNFIFLLPPMVLLSYKWS